MRRTHSLWRRPLAVVTALALTGSLGLTLSGTVAPTASAAQNPGGAYEVPENLLETYNQKLSWAPCNDGDPFGQCATLKVPLDYDNPGHGTISVALRKIPASDGHAEKGALVTNPGGPGSSGSRWAVVFGAMLNSDVRASYDIIGFDPRGVGASTPLTCWSQQDVDDYIKGLQGPQLNTPAEGDSAPDAVDDKGRIDAVQEAGASQVQVDQAPTAASMYANAQKMAAACATYSEVPEILDFMDSNSVTHDMDVMRHVLGDRKLNYLGVSYGTYLGEEYLSDFPENAGAFVLDSPMDPSMTLRQIHDDDVANYEYNLRVFVEQWQATGSSPLAGTPEEGKYQLYLWLTTLDDKPLTVDGTSDTIDKAGAIRILKYVTAHHKDYWPTLMPTLGEAMSTGNGTSFQSAYAAIQTAVDGGAPTFPMDTPTPEQVVATWNATYAFYGVHCSDYTPQGDEAEWDAHAAEVQAAWPVMTTPDNAYADAVCAGWGHHDYAEPPEPVDGDSSEEVLVVGSYDDPRTPYPWAVSVANQLDNATLLTVNAPIHGALEGNSCAGRWINAFLMDRTLPKEGTICPAEPRFPVMPQPQG